MPDQLAHFRFARHVLAATDSKLRARVSADAPAFRAGTFGPDPLFNDPSPRRRAEGFEIHRRSGREALDRMRESVKRGMPCAAEYAAGFFCHYALDRICHPDIRIMAERGAARHVAIESAYDRELYMRRREKLPMRLKLDEDALRAAAQMYHRLTPRQYAADVQIFWQIRRFLILSGGTPIAYIPAKLKPAWDGLIPYRTPSPELRACFARLDELMQSAVAPVAEQLALYYDAIERDLPLDPWTNADFSGFQTKP